MTWTSRAGRVVVGGAAVGALLVGGGAVAGAQADAPESTAPPGPGPVTITLSADQVTRLCDRRLPRIERRATRLIERIEGDAGTRGSAEWLRARADRERAAGREASARLLAERADRRAERVDQLAGVTRWAADFRAAHCGAK